MTEALAEDTGRKLGSRFTLLDKLGVGGQGEVWRARDSLKGVDVALKVVAVTPGGEEAAWKRLEHEYAIASRLDHACILKVFQPERIGDAMVLPMELAPGGDLRRLRGAGFLEVIPVLLEIAQALEHAHERGVIHRDLKPGNVLFDGRGRARLADFGVAETALDAGPALDASGAASASNPAPEGSAGPPSRDTNRHGFSPFTASPAQLRGEPPTPGDDIYSLGALAYELLSGYPPYYPRFDRKRAIEEPVPKLVPAHQIPPLLGTLVMNMLAKNPRRRPQSMREVIDELDAALNDTLTYDFDSVSSTSQKANIGSAAQAPREASSPVWTPASRDRRSSPDRRVRRAEDLPQPRSQPASKLARVQTQGTAPEPRNSESPNSESRNSESRNDETLMLPPLNWGPDPRFDDEKAVVRSNTEHSEEGRGDHTVALPPLNWGPDPRFDDEESEAPSPTRATGTAHRAPPAVRSPAFNRTPSSERARPPAASNDAHLRDRTVVLPPAASPAPNSDTRHNDRTVVMPPAPAAAALNADTHQRDRTVVLPPAAAPGPSGDTQYRDRTVVLPPATPGAARNQDRTVVLPPPAGSRAQPVDHKPAAQASAAPRTPPRSGAEALARIDAALERAAAESTQDRRNDHVANTVQDRPFVDSPEKPITPQEAAAIVTAARAAAAAGANPSHSTSRGSYAPPTDAPHPSYGEVTQVMPPKPAAPMWPTDAPARAGGSASATPTVATPSTANKVAAAAPASVPPQTNSVRGTYADVIVPERGTPASGSWDGIPLDSLPKVSRLEPIRARRWPWAVVGLTAAAVGVVIFWVPRFNTQELPPDVAAVVNPIQTALKDAAAKIPPTTGATNNSPVEAATHSTSGTNTGAETRPTPAPNSAVANGSAAAMNQAAPAAKSTSPASVADPVGSGTPAVPPAAKTTQPAPAAPDTSDEQRFRSMRQTYDTRVAALESRGAGVWGGQDFALSKSRAAESVGAHDAGSLRLAQERLAAALKLLDTVETKAPQALSQQVAAGEKALKTGQQEVAGQAFELARRISPADRRASDGQRRAQNLNAVLPLLADAQNAEVARDFARAAQDYSQALFLDPTNATAKAGQARANAAFGDDSYAKAIGKGFAALGAGRLDEAHDAFVKARSLKPTGSEAAEGLRRVGAALTARGFASMRQRAVGLEAQERWAEAERTYEDVLAADPSLAFAQEGKARTASRADLYSRLQQVLDRPDRLSMSGVREDARALLETARAQTPQGPIMRSQIARLETLLPGSDKTVRLSVLSDNSTKVAISSVGSFGAFARRDIELRPGRYTVVGTRDGFRDVRREITVAPGQEAQTIKVTCSDPI